VNTEDFLDSLGTEEEVQKKFGHGRKFLNKGEGLAAVEWSVRGDTWKPRRNDKVKKRVNIDADFTVSDCNRQVTLDFGTWTKKDLTTKLQKAFDLRNQLDGFITALENAVTWAEGEWPE